MKSTNQGQRRRQKQVGIRSENNSLTASKHRIQKYNSSSTRQQPEEEQLYDEEGKPVQRNAANARERARMRVLSKAFCKLKTTLPWVPADTKLSKLDTLRLASSYIGHLRKMLTEDQNHPGAQMIHPLALTWPFTLTARQQPPQLQVHLGNRNTMTTYDEQTVYEKLQAMGAVGSTTLIR